MFIDHDFFSTETYTRTASKRLRVISSELRYTPSLKSSLLHKGDPISKKLLCKTGFILMALIYTVKYSKSDRF